MQQNYNSKETSENSQTFNSIILGENNSSQTFNTKISLQNKKNNHKNKKQNKRDNSPINISINILSDENSTPKHEIQLNNIGKDCQNNGEKYETGKWSDKEHEKFIEGILLYGNEWKKVQQIIKTRSSSQARSHAQKFYLKIKKKFKLNENMSNNKEKKKVIDKIIKSILPKKKIDSLTQNQKERLLSAISCNIKTEENSDYEDDIHLGLEEMDNLQFKSDISDNNVIINNRKISLDLSNIFLNEEINRPNKFSLGRKRKFSKTIDSKDRLLYNKKGESHRPSFDLSFNKMNEKENNDDMSEINNYVMCENNNCHKNGSNNEYMSKYLMNNINLSNNQNVNLDNKNNFIINNFINVTNNIINNNFVYNIFNSETINNNNCNQDFNFYEKNDSINNEKNQIFFGNSKNQYIFNDKTFLNENQYNKYINANNLNNCKVNNNNQVDPFQLNFNNISSENFSDLENERQMAVFENDLYLVK